MMYFEFFILIRKQTEFRAFWCTTTSKRILLKRSIFISSPPNSTPRRLSSYFHMTLLLYFLFIFYLPRCNLSGFPSISSRASLPFLCCCQRTTTCLFLPNLIFFTLRDICKRNFNKILFFGYSLAFISTRNRNAFMRVDHGAQSQKLNAPPTWLPNYTRPVYAISAYQFLVCNFCNFCIFCIPVYVILYSLPRGWRLSTSWGFEIRARALKRPSRK